MAHHSVYTVAVFEDTTMKTLLAIIAIVTFSFWGYHKYQSNKSELDEFLHYNAPAKAPSSSAPAVVKLDIGVLDSLNSRLMGSCADNKYGLTEEACVQTIKERRGPCQAQTVTNFPEQPSTQVRMQAVVSSHTNCLFQYVMVKHN